MNDAARDRHRRIWKAQGAGRSHRVGIRRMFDDLAEMLRIWCAPALEGDAAAALEDEIEALLAMKARVFSALAREEISPEAVLLRLSHECRPVLSELKTGAITEAEAARAMSTAFASCGVPMGRASGKPAKHVKREWEHKTSTAWPKEIEGHLHPKGAVREWLDGNARGTGPAKAAAELLARVTDSSHSSIERQLRRARKPE